MWYTLKRTWPGLVKTLMVCGTICFVCYLVFMCQTPQKDVVAPNNTETEQLQAQIRDIREDLEQHKRAIVRIVELNPALLPAIQSLVGKWGTARIADGKVEVVTD